MADFRQEPPVINAGIKRLLRWDERTPWEKSAALYRARNLLATAICLLPVPVWRLLGLFGSDKHRPDAHLYGWTYQALFRPLKYRRIKLLEIGVGGDDNDVGGRSLLAWQAFFPFATIIGVDHLPRETVATWHTRFRRADQGSAEDLALLCADEGPFDVIIDDGSHLSQHQLFSFDHLFNALKDGGIYVIEDVHTSYWPSEAEVGGIHWDGADIEDPGFSRTCMGYFLELAKHLNHAEFLRPREPSLAWRIDSISFEHNLITVRKGANDDPSILRLLQSGNGRRQNAMMAGDHYVHPIGRGEPAHARTRQTRQHGESAHRRP
jgi:hypothetical protein